MLTEEEYTIHALTIQKHARDFAMELDVSLPHKQQCLKKIDAAILEFMEERKAKNGVKQSATLTTSDEAFAAAIIAGIKDFKY